MNRRSLFGDHVLLLLLCAVLYVPFLGGSVLWDYDEGYFGAIAKEMFEKGEWIVPTFSDRELGDKPILIFWGMLVSFSIFGVSEFAVRFPSVLWGTGTVLLTYHLARRLFQERTIGLRAAFILATMLLFVVETRGTTCDGAMICWITAALTVYVYGCRGFRADFVETPTDSLRERIAPWFPDRWPAVVTMYACMGVATLAKGPAACVMATAVIGLFLILKAYPGHLRENPLHWLTAFIRVCWAMRPLTAVATIFVVAAPWFLAVGYKTDWEWTTMFFVEHNFNRSIAPIRSHKGFPFFYSITSLFGTFPWSLFLLPWLIDLGRRVWRGVGPKNGFLFAICWIVFFYVFFAFVSTKLMHYVAPAYPALAMLVGSYLFHWRRGEELTEKFWTPVIFVNQIILGIILIVVLPPLLSKYFPGEHLIGVMIGLLPLLVGVAGIVLYRNGNRQTLERLHGLFAVLFVVLLFQWGATTVSKHAAHDDVFFKPVADSVDAEGKTIPPLILCVGQEAPSWIYYSNRPFRSVGVDFFNLWVGSGTPPAEIFAQLRRRLEEKERTKSKYFAGADDRFLREGRLYVVVDEPNYEQYVKPILGGGLKEVSRMHRFMKKNDQLLLEWVP